MAKPRGSVWRHGWRVALGLLCVLALLGHGAGLWPLAWVHQLDRQIHDARLQAARPSAPHPRVVVVERNTALLLSAVFPKNTMVPQTPYAPQLARTAVGSNRPIPNTGTQSMWFMACLH